MSASVPEYESRELPLEEGGSRQLALVKDGKRFVFRYALGAESEVLSQMLELARDPESNFDTFDAAVLSHQLGQQMSQQLKSLDKAS
jgi:hypothetical protein